MAKPSPRTLSFICSGINLTISLSSLACLAGVLISSTIISAILPQFIYDLFKFILEAPSTITAFYILLSLLSVGFSLLQLFTTWAEQCNLVMVCLVYHLVSFLPWRKSHVDPKNIANCYLNLGELCGGRLGRAGGLLLDRVAKCYGYDKYTCVEILTCKFSYV